MATFDENGNYIKTDWKAGDKITAAKLNKIEESIEAVNNNDISRHVEADARLDKLESGTASDKQAINAKVDALEDVVEANKDATDLEIYSINQHMTLLDKKMDDGVAEVEAIANTVDGKIAAAETNMNNIADTVDGKIAAAETNMQNQVNQGKADMEAMVAEVEGELEGLQNGKLNFIKISDSYNFEEIKSILENSENCVIVFENGFYTFDDEILFENKSNITINFNYSQILLNQVVGMKSVFKFINSNNFEFSNVIIDGNRDINGSNNANQDGGNHGLSINHSTNLVFNNVNAINCGTDGVYIGSIDSTGRINSNLLFKNCLFDTNSRQGVSIIEGENITFISCGFVNTNGKSPQAGVDIEPVSRTRYIKNIHFQDCNFENNQGRGLMQHDAASKSIDTITFDNCKIINNNDDDLAFTTKTTLSYLDNIIIANCEIGRFTISEIHSDKNVNVNIDNSKIAYIKNAPKILFTLNSSELGSIALYEALKAYNCFFDSGYSNRDGVYQYDPPVNGTSVFQNCIFGQYQRYTFMQISDCLIDSCLFKSPPSDEYSTMPCIEPLYQEECNLMIRNCTFLGNSVRFPDKTSGVTVITSGGVKEIPSSTDRNKSINCYKI